MAIAGAETLLEEHKLYSANAFEGGEKSATVPYVRIQGYDAF